MKKFYTLFVGLLFCFLLVGQVSQLNDPLMSGGKMRGYAKNATSVLVCNDGGLFRTTNGGQSWTNVTQAFNPLLVKSRHVVTLGNDYYAESDYNSGVGIYKSTDNGTNWTSLNPSLFSTWQPQSLGKIASTLYVVAVNNTISGQTGQLYASTDGSTWSPKAVLWTNINLGYSANLLSFNQNKLYIYLHNAMYYTTDGTTITTISVSGLGITGFSNDSQDNMMGDALGNLFYYQNGTNAVYKYNFTTSTWSDITTGKVPANGQIMEVSVTDNNLFLVVLPTGSNMKFYKSSDQGSTLVEQTSTGLTTPDISNIIEISTTGFIGNGLYNEILYSTTGGSSWQASTTPFIATYAGNLTRSGNALMVALQNRGLIYSSNQGVNWTTKNSTIPGYGGIAYFVNELIQVKDTLFSFIQPTPFSQSVVLYKSTNNGASWTPSPIPAAYAKGNAYSFAGKCDSALFVNYYDSVSTKYAVIATFNNGTSWVKPNSTNSDQLTYFKGTKNFLFAFNGYYQNYNDFNNIYKANNFGMSFTSINPSNLINDNFLIKRMEDLQGNKLEPVMDIDVANNRAIFAISDHTLGNVDRLYLYNMSTNTWSELTPTGIPANYSPNCIKNTGNNTWLLATNLGVYKSVNGGANWTLAHSATGWLNGITVARIQIIGNQVFLGTLHDGVWTVNLTTGTVEPLTDKDLVVYPNPGADILQVSIPEFTGQQATITVYSMDGKIVMQQTAATNHFQLDIHSLPAGNYLLLVGSTNHTYRKTIIRN